MKTKKHTVSAVFFLTLFLTWTVAVASVDIRAIGPAGTSVGFAGLNGFVHRMTGVHMALYRLTDRLSLLPAVFILGFALLGLFQWVGRRSLRNVDRSILVMGIFYLVTGSVYLFFEKCVVNYRPVLIGGNLEASYPSSTTVLVICVMSTAAMELKKRIRNPYLRKPVLLLMAFFTAFMVLGRLISGVHWISDIIGGILLAAGLVALYAALSE